MKYSYLLITILTLTILSCSTSNKNDRQTRTQSQSQSSNNEAITSSPPGNESASSASSNQAVPSESASPAISGQTIPAETAANVVLNPPHGEPGHSCDIPVGSPLNPPAATAAPRVSFAPTVENAARLGSSRTSRSTSPAAGSGAPLNPPHGEPGHRCEIPVGSPLY